MKCLICDTEFEPKRSDAKTCSAKCRTKLSRSRPFATGPNDSTPAYDSGLPTKITGTAINVSAAVPSTGPAYDPKELAAVWAKPKHHPRCDCLMCKPPKGAK